MRLTQLLPCNLCESKYRVLEHSKPARPHPCYRSQRRTMHVGRALIVLIWRRERIRKKIEGRKILSLDSAKDLNLRA